MRGNREGHAVFQWPDGSQFIGSFKANCQHGLGVNVDAKGNTRAGVWKQGKLLRYID